MEQGIKEYYKNTSTDINIEYRDNNISIVKLANKHDKNTYILKIKNMLTDNEEILECSTVVRKASSIREKKVREAKK